MTDVAKQPRIRRLTLEQTVSAEQLSLNVDIIDTGTINLDLTIATVSPSFLHKLALRGIASFVQDRTAKVTELEALPAAIASIFNSIKDETIFNSLRTVNTKVGLPKFVEAILVRDGQDVNDVVTRQAALLEWDSLTESEKKDIRADKQLRSLVAIANGEEAKVKLGLTE